MAMLITSVSANHVTTFGGNRANMPVTIPVTPGTRPMENVKPQQVNDKNCKKCTCKICNKKNKKACNNQSQVKYNITNNAYSSQANKSFGNMRR